MFAIKKRRRTEVAVGQYWRTVSPVPCDWEVVRFYQDPEGGYALIQEPFVDQAEILDSA